MKELTSILKKKTWTGREVGLALLKTIDDQVQERKRNPKKRTFTEDDIKRMEANERMRTATQSFEKKSEEKK